MKPITLFRSSLTVSSVVACSLLSGCLSVPFDIAESVVDTSLSVAETAVTTPFDIAEAIVDFPPDLIAKHIEEENWTFDSEGITSLEAETVNGSITITGTDEDRITIHSWKEIRARNDRDAEKFADRIELFVSRNDHELRIEKSIPHKPKKIGISISYEIQVPHSMDLNLSTSNGSIHAESVNGSLRLRTSNGKIMLSECGGSVDAVTHNDRIEATLTCLKHSGRFVTYNGSVNVSIAEGEGDVKIETHNGSIDLALPGDFTGELDAKASNGSVHSDLPVLVRTAGRNQLTGDFGSGGHNKIDLRTYNGSIHLTNSWENTEQ